MKVVDQFTVTYPVQLELIYTMLEYLPSSFPSAELPSRNRVLYLSLNFLHLTPSFVSYRSAPLPRCRLLQAP